MSEQNESPEVIVVGDETQQAVIDFIRSLGLSPKQTGDLTLTCDMPVAGAVAFDVKVRMWATPTQIEKLKAFTDKLNGRVAAEILNCDAPSLPAHTMEWELKHGAESPEAE